MEVGVPLDAENPAPVPIPSLGPDQDIPSAGTDSGAGACRSVDGVHGGVDAGLPECGVSIQVQHGPIIQVIPPVAMHNNDVLPPTHALGEVSDRQIAHPLGLDGMSAQESAAYAKLKWFCSSLVKSKKLSEHKSNKASQVENVLMRALGLVPDDLDVDDMVVTEMQNIFDSPLQDQHVRVIAALFGKEVPPMDVLEKGSASEVLAL
ncbi:hypothetical protein ZWY2020_009605 [Hordeum vulgare]|nr:hypothetical protein ZWY2020_009605 [Hordeum vulgare]